METKTFERKYKEALPVLAICYDFDKTLSPDDMQAQGYIQSVGYDIKEFWQQSNTLAEENDMDQNLAYMYMMVDKAAGYHIFNRKTLEEYGSKVALFPGVQEWFERIRAYGKQQGVIVEHYIISSGLKEMIEGTQMAKDGAFEKIYASSFYFGESGVVKWPAQVVNYTNKTQFLFRIQKGILDVNDQGVNDFFPPNELRVPFRNMVYIGDSDTDIPCMKLVNSYGGHSIGVYNPYTGDKQKVYKMIHDNRIKYFAPADYSEGAELDALVKAIIDRTAANEQLENFHFRYQTEVAEAGRLDSRDEEDHLKDDLISQLQGSRNFAFTHLMLEKLRVYQHWTDAQREALFDALLRNAQISWILGDPDVYEFYSQLVEDGGITESKETVAAMLRQIQPQ